jgi:hypothetical protein
MGIGMGIGTGTGMSLGTGMTLGMGIDIGMGIVNAWAWKGQDKPKPGTKNAGGSRWYICTENFTGAEPERWRI